MTIIQIKKDNSGSTQMPHCSITIPSCPSPLAATPCDQCYQCIISRVWLLSLSVSFVKFIIPLISLL